MNEVVVQEPDHETGLPGHGGMGSMARELIAQNRVFRVVWTAPDDVARVKVAHDEGNVPRLEPRFDLLAQEHADVTELDVSRRVALRSRVSEQVLSRAFSHGDDRVSSVHYPLFQSGKKSVL